MYLDEPSTLNRSHLDEPSTLHLDEPSTPCRETLLPLRRLP